MVGGSRADDGGERHGGTLALRVNVVKFLLLAALVPPVTAGIAQRVAALDPAADQASAVAWIAAGGSASAVAGALALGRAADALGASRRARWTALLAGAALGLAGIGVAAAAPSTAGLAAGWLLAQFGCSGAMAVSRVLLAHLRGSRRERGATVMVLVSYIGASVPIALMLALPGSSWAIAAGLAVLAIVLPAAALLPAPAGRNAPTPDATTASPDPRPGRTAPAAPAPHPVPAPPSLRPAEILLVALALHLTLAAYLAFHPLDLAHRLGVLWGDDVARLSALVVAAAIAGLALATAALIARPALVARPRPLVVAAAVVLAVSIAGRGLGGTAPVVILSALASGAGVGILSSALFAAALDRAARSTGGAGRFIGRYSAAGALGQLIGPLAGLAVVHATSEPLGYGPLFVAIAVVPLAAGLGIALARSPQPAPREA